MTLLKFKPSTPSRRGLVLVNKRKLWKDKPFKRLVVKKNSTGGRNNTGRITVNGRFKGHKKAYRIIDFKRNLQKGCVQRIEYDPNRTAFIALLKGSASDYSYIIAPQGITVGDTVQSGSSVEFKVGNSMPLKYIPVGTFIHNIEFKPYKGGQMIRAAGTSATLVSKTDNSVQIKLPSGEIRIINHKCKATIGVISNNDNKNIKLGKAGRKNWLGLRPKVRGVAKNPIDHPHGGGEGKTSGGRVPVNFKGNLIKGSKSRNNKRTEKFILSRHK